jgi:hypothetical protein
VGKILRYHKFALVIKCVGMLAHVPSSVSITVSVPNSSDTEEVFIIPQKLLHIRPVTVEQLSYQFWAIFLYAASYVQISYSGGAQALLKKCPVDAKQASVLYTPLQTS